MQPREYETLRSLEDHYWWYQVLHGLVRRELMARLPLKAQVSERRHGGTENDPGSAEFIPQHSASTQAGGMTSKQRHFPSATRCAIDGLVPRPPGSLRLAVSLSLGSALLGSQARVRVLDAGCGTGGMMEVLRRCQPEWEVAGIDANATAVSHCLERGLAAVRGDVGELPFAPGSFDAVLSLDVLYHADVDESQTLAEMTRVLKPGGVLILNLPAFESLRGSHDAAVCGVRRYKACHVRQLLENRNLSVDMIHYWNAWLFLPLLMKRRWSLSVSAKSPTAAAVSDLSMPPRWLNMLLTTAGRVDAAACRVLHLPWGSSVFAVAVKSEET